jgi:hypothetical protein
MAKQLKVVENLLSSYEEDRRELQNEIKERMRTKGHSRIVGDGVAVSWSAVKGRETVDMAALRAAAMKIGFDIEQFSRPGQPGDRLTVTLKKAAHAA